MRADAQANREKILVAARALFIERGVEVDVREIAAQAEVGMGTLYRHFPTKEELVDAIIPEVAADMSALMSRFGRGENVRPPLVEWLELHEQWGQLGRELHTRLAWARHMTSEAETRAAVRQAESLWEQRWGQWRDLRAAGGLRDDIPTEFMMEAQDLLLGMYLEVRKRWNPEDARWWLAAIYTEGVQPRKNWRSSLEEKPSRD